jgi:hypothetical protein
MDMSPVLSPASRLLISRRAAEVGVSAEQAFTDARVRARLLLSARDFALIINLPLWKVYRLAADQQVPHHRQGRRLVFSVDDAFMYLREEENINEEDPCIVTSYCQGVRARTTASVWRSRLQQRQWRCHPPGRFDA